MQAAEDAARDSKEQELEEQVAAAAVALADMRDRAGAKLGALVSQVRQRAW